MISLAYQFIDQWRWRFATLEVHLYGSDRNFCEYEGSASELCWANAAEGKLCEGLQASLEALSLIAHTASQWCRPIALHEIVTAVEEQQPSIIQVPAHPCRRVERSGKPITSLDGCDEALLIGERGRQPQLTEKRVARSEAIVERSLWGVQPLHDGIDRHGGGAALARSRAGGGEETRIVKDCSTHRFRLNGLDRFVYM